MATTNPLRPYKPVYTLQKNQHKTNRENRRFTKYFEIISILFARWHVHRLF